MPELQSKSELEVVDRGPDWLFVKFGPMSIGLTRWPSDCGHF